MKTERINRIVDSLTTVIKELVKEFVGEKEDESTNDNETTDTGNDRAEAVDD